jgi:hypothetical protein
MSGMVISLEVLLLLRTPFTFLCFFVIPDEVENCSFYLCEEIETPPLLMGLQDGTTLEINLVVS